MTEPKVEMTFGVKTLGRSVVGQIFNFLFERPLGIGFMVGMTIGALNSYFFGIPIVTSMILGSVIGVTVCIIACPAMKTIVKQHRERIRERNLAIKMRSRAVSVFTSLE